MTSIYDKESFLINDVVVQVWESQTGWKWQITPLEDDSPLRSMSGYACDNQTLALLMAMTAMTQESIRKFDRNQFEELCALFPNFETYYHTATPADESGESEAR